MLAYAANGRSRRRFSSSTLLLIVGGHAVAIGLLITAKMTIDVFERPGPTVIYDVPLDPPPPDDLKPKPQAQPDTMLPPPPDSRVDKFPPIIPRPVPNAETFDTGPAIGSDIPDIGPALNTPLGPTQPIVPPPAVVKVGPRAATPADLLRPPYPESMRRSEAEAVLRLRLSIDERGRVTAVEPLGAADPAFVASARSHLIRYWRYRPATEDGRAVSSSLVITLRFELEE